MLLSEIASVLQIGSAQIGQDISIKYISFDTRKLIGSVDTLFVAIPGKQHNGHDYLMDAYKKGVRNFIVSKKIDQTGLFGANILRVYDSLMALQSIVKYHRGGFDIPVVGITGSNGKTIVKEWLSDMLQEKYHVVKSPKSYNSQLGVPISIWAMNAEHEVGVFEAGISRRGEMHRLESVIQPTIGVFTNIGNAHDEGFHTWEEKIEEKAFLFAETHQIICCQDHETLYPILKNQFDDALISWSTVDSSADFYFNKVGKSYRCEFDGAEYEIAPQFSGAQYLENLLHAVCVCILLDLTPEQIALAIKRLRPVSMRLELKRGLHDCYIVDDTYNNDLVGLSIALEYLKEQPHKQKKTAIISDIEQSGLSDDQLYLKVAKLLETNEITRLIAIGSKISANKDVFGHHADFYPDTETFFKNFPAFDNELILVKGARTFSLEKVVSILEEKNHGTLLEVNFEALSHNLNLYRQKLASTTKVMVMVKAFAYGGGLGEIAHLLQYQKVDYLGVAYLDEGIALRKKGISLPIMVMNVDWNHLSMAHSFVLEPEIYSSQMLRKYLVDCEQMAPIHLKIESGMNRLGFDGEDLPELIQLLKEYPELKVAGIFTHFSATEEQEHDEFTQRQAYLFDQAYQAITDAIGYLPIKHALNSSGIVRWPQYQYDMVRLGIGLYGYDSSESMEDLLPVSHLKSHISQIRHIKKNETVGYSRTGVAKQDSTIAVVAIGYADGYSRKFSMGNAYMLVNGQKAYTIGNVCMDMTMIDITNLNASEGDEVMVFGESPSIVDLAAWSETIPYEILTNVSQRVKRIFVSE